MLNAEIGANAVDGSKILDAAIANADLADGSVGANKIQTRRSTSAKVLDDRLGRGLDLATNAVGQAEIATDGVAATEIQNDSIDAGEIVDFGLTNQDVGVLFAEVTAAGGLNNSSGGVTVDATRSAPPAPASTRSTSGATSRSARPSPRSVSATPGTSSGEVNVSDRAGNAEAVFVDTNTSAGAAADRPFRLVVVC